jgi:CTP:molybdopterin cytidylyltransferase MocA
MQGTNKLLTKVNGVPMLRGVTQAALKSNVDEVIVVLGFEAEKVKETIADLSCRIVINKDYEKGQSSSLITGMRVINKSTVAVLVLPGDLARIETSSINQVVQSYMKEGGHIVSAAYNGRLGHPILLSKELFDEIMLITEETSGLKTVVTNHRNEMRLVETYTENVLTDVDSPDDLRKLADKC